MNENEGKWRDLWDTWEVEWTTWWLLGWGSDKGETDVKSDSQISDLSSQADNGSIYGEKRYLELAREGRGGSRFLAEGEL